MKLALPTVLLASSLFLGACATREAAPTSVEALFVAADVERDGKVSRDEFVDFLIEDAFVRYDRNGDGYVDLVEAEAVGAPAAAFQKLNRSGSGKVTLAEAKASPAIRARMAVPFDEADVNKSGFVTLEEFRAWKLRAQPYVR